jgi:hypothetical protein
MGCAAKILEYIHALGFDEAATLNPIPDISLATKSGHFNLLTTSSEGRRAHPPPIQCFSLLNTEGEQWET